MERLLKIINKDERLVIGLMSGTSVDGIDAALVKINGKGTNTKVELLHYESFPYSDSIRKDIFKLFSVKDCRVDYLCHMNFLLGELFADAAIKLVKLAGYSMEQIDIIGSHGQTVYHIPEPIEHMGYKVRSTLQIGEPSVIAERTGVITVADFRVRDIAAGGQGAPLVPYTEYLLYREDEKTVALQNIGGIANITVLPKGCTIDEVYAFDNSPGNMVIDEVVYRITDGEKRFDEGGNIAKCGKVNIELLDILMDNNYFKLSPPKTTGRELFGTQYVDKLMEISQSLGLSGPDIVATATALTARAIAESCREYIIPEHGLDKLIVGGGGSYNKTLIEMIKENLKGVSVLTQEDIGLNSDAKEAVAFAILANETINGNFNNVPKATGAKHGVIMGKIIL